MNDQCLGLKREVRRSWELLHGFQTHRVEGHCRLSMHIYFALAML